MVLLRLSAVFYFLRDVAGTKKYKILVSIIKLQRDIWKVKTIWIKIESWWVRFVFYLLCIGLEPLLGILLKLFFSPVSDSSFISLLICKSLTALLEAGAMWRPSTLFLLIYKARSNRIRAVEIDSHVRNLFIVNPLFLFFSYFGALRFFCSWDCNWEFFLSS